MGTRLAIALALLGSTAQAQSNLQVELTHQLNLPDRSNVVVQVEGCQITWTDTHLEPAHDGLPASKEETVTSIWLGDYQTAGEAVELATRPEVHPETGALGYVLAYPPNQAFYTDLSKDLQRYNEAQFETELGSLQIFWYIITGAEELLTQEQRTLGAAAKAGEYGEYIARNWSENIYSEEDYSSYFFTPAYGAVFTLYGRERETLLAMIDEHRRAHCP